MILESIENQTAQAPCAEWSIETWLSWLQTHDLSYQIGNLGYGREIKAFIADWEEGVRANGHGYGETSAKAFWNTWQNFHVIFRAKPLPNQVNTGPSTAPDLSDLGL